jgi:hypothetical protein
MQRGARHRDDDPRDAHHDHRLQRHGRPERHKEKSRIPIAAGVYQAANAPQHHEQPNLGDRHHECRDENAATKRGRRLERDGHSDLRAGQAHSCEGYRIGGRDSGCQLTIAD